MARSKDKDRASQSAKKVGSRNHAPYFPPYRDKHPRWHDIAFLQYEGPNRRRIMWADRGLKQNTSVSSYGEWKDALLSQSSIFVTDSGRSTHRGVDCYVLEISSDDNGFPWIYDLLSDNEAVVSLNSDSAITGIHLRHGNTWISVGSISHWTSRINECDPLEIIEDVAALGDATGAGTHMSPGSMGMFILRRSWGYPDGHRWPVVSRPPDLCRHDILANTVGGRAEVWVKDRVFTVAYEYDLRNAYASCCIPIPWGSVTTSYDESIDSLDRRFATYFARCTVRWSRRLEISPIAVRGHRMGRGGGWVYPQEPGTYGSSSRDPGHELWLWREAIEAAINAGIDVQVHKAYCWDETSTRLASWVYEMDHYRDAYEANGRSDQAERIKSSIVATIGRMGMAPYRRTLVSYQNYSSGDMPLVHRKGGAPITTHYIHVDYWRNSSAPVHIWSHIISKCALKLYDRERMEIRNGNELILSNFDAYYAANPSSLEIGTGMGEWREREHHELAARYNRAFTSRESIKLPGLPRGSQVRRAYVNT